MNLNGNNQFLRHFYVHQMGRGTTCLDENQDVRSKALCTAIQVYEKSGFGLMKHTSFNHFKILPYEMGKIVFLNENGRCDMVLLYIEEEVTANMCTVREPRWVPGGPRHIWILVA